MELKYFELKYLEKRLKDMLKEKLEESIEGLVQKYDLREGPREQQGGQPSEELKQYIQQALKEGLDPYNAQRKSSPTISFLRTTKPQSRQSKKSLVDTNKRQNHAVFNSISLRNEE